MKVVRAEEMGMCFGVRDALRMTATVREPARVTIHGELVHNPEVSTQLAARGFRQSAEQDRAALPETPVVLITAHGLSNAERGRLAAAHKQLIDTTCPLVRRAHDAALELQAEGRYVLMIGKRGHVEVQGIVDDLQSYDVIETADEARRYESQKLGIVCQTTVPPDVAAAIRGRVRLLNPLADVRDVATICQPTLLRQRAMRELVTRVDAVVVVGGRHSNNTRQLVRFCEEHRTAVLHVERADELDPAWFANVETVGLTAGTSTLDSTINEVEQALAQIETRRWKEEPHAENGSPGPRRTYS
jgi:4-hydroxy-3-methylbut-2-enyl diphosphate reductase